jgi:hypothetical protein
VVAGCAEVRLLLSPAAADAQGSLCWLHFRAQLRKTRGAIPLSIATRDPLKNPFKRFFQRDGVEWFR